MRTKIDTGARTSALHVGDLSFFEREGVKWVRFTIPASELHHSTHVEVPLHDERPIKNTSGVPENRPIIEVLMKLGQRRWRIEVSLADRSNMGFDMILGRTAIRRRKLLVNPGRSFLLGEPDVQNEDRQPKTHLSEERTMAPVQDKQNEGGGKP